MKAQLNDAEALKLITPAALTSYALSAGWTKRESYGPHADLYTGRRLPEIILPKDNSLADYPNVVARLIDVFSRVSDHDELSLYRNLFVADRDVVRVRVYQGTLTMGDSLRLISASRDVLVATASSLNRDPQPSYHPNNKDARDLVSKLQLGHTESGSFVVTVLTPVLAPESGKSASSFLGEEDRDAIPDARRLTHRLTEALGIARSMIEKHTDLVISRAVSMGMSSNRCDALSALIEPFPRVSLRVSWAMTRPRKPHGGVTFKKEDIDALNRTSHTFRQQRGDNSNEVVLEGFVKRLKREATESGGVVQILASVHGSKKESTIEAVLDPSDYEKAIDAHRHQANIIISGRLSRTNNRSYLLSPHISEVISEGKLGF